MRVSSSASREKSSTSSLRWGPSPRHRGCPVVNDDHDEASSSRSSAAKILGISPVGGSVQCGRAVSLRSPAGGAGWAVAADSGSSSASSGKRIVGRGSPTLGVSGRSPNFGSSLPRRFATSSRSSASAASSAPMIRTPSLSGDRSLSSFFGTGPPSGCRRPPRSDLEELGVLVVAGPPDGGIVGVSDAIELLLGPNDVVLAGLAVAREGVELAPCIPAGVAHRHPPVFRHVLDLLDELAAPLLGERREGESDDDPVAARVDSEVGVADRLLDRVQRPLVVRLNDKEPGFLDPDLGELLQ